MMRVLDLFSCRSRTAEGEVMETLGERVARLRIAKGYSQRFVAQRIGVDHRVMIRVERDETRPRAASLHPLARVLGVTTDYLLTGREAPHLAALHAAIRANAPRERLLAMVERTDV